MGYTTDFAAVTSGTGAELAQDLDEAGLLGTIPCTVAGTNALVMTPAVNAPSIVLQTQLRVSGIAVATNTGATTAAVDGTPALGIYKDGPSGPVVLTGNEIVIGNYFTLAYDPVLASGAGGYHLGTPTISAAGTVTNVATGAGLTGGPITNTGTISLGAVADKRFLANISGGAAVPVANSLSGILDNIISSVNGAMLQRVGGTWVAALRGQILGTATNDDAGAGDIGEFISAQVLSGSAISLTNNVAVNVASISLTAGDWNVWADIRFTGGATTVVNTLFGGLSTTSASLDSTGLGRLTTVVPAGGTPFNFTGVNFAVGPSRFTLSGTTTVYLVASSGFGTSNNTVYGDLMARRVR